MISDKDCFNISVTARCLCGGDGSGFSRYLLPLKDFQCDGKTSDVLLLSLQASLILIPSLLASPAILY